MNGIGIARIQLRTDEAVRQFPYDDSTGKTVLLPVGKISIGIGRNLNDVGLRPDEIALCFENDLRDAERLARNLLSTYDQLSEVRKAVVLNMAFNLGTRLATFVNTLKHINAGRWEAAAEGMLESKWAGQVGLRAIRLADMMRNDRL